MASQAQSAGGTTALAPRDTSPVGVFQRQLEDRASDLRMALPAGLSPEKFQRTVLTAVAQNQDLLKADRASLILSCYKAAQDGLLPDGREAALVTFNQRRKGEGGQWETVKLVQYMPMVYGLRKKILQAKDADGHPIVSALQVGVVYKVEVAEGYFLWERGGDPEIQHRPMMEITKEEAADENIMAAYSIATMRDGTRSCEVLRRFEIDDIRQMSQTGAVGRTVQFGNDKGKPIEPKGPWVDWFAEMAKKTVMRRHAKTLPMSGDVIADLGGEDDEVRASKSSALFLGGTQPDRPELITDQDGDTIDSSTGEIVAEQNTQEASGTAREAPGAEESTSAKSDSVSASPTSDGRSEATAEPEDKKPAAGKKAKPATAKENADQPAQEADPAQDELGVTKDPAEVKAEQILADMKTAAAESLEALDAVYAREESHIMALPDEFRTVVDAAYTRHTRKFAEVRPEREPAE